MLKRVFLILIGFILFIKNVHAFSLIGIKEDATPIKWEDNIIKIEFYTEGYSGIRDGSDFEAFSRGAESWNEVLCSDLIMEVVETNQSTIDYSDYISRVVWQNNQQGWEYGDYVLAVTLPIPNDFGYLIDADIIFNGNIEWSASDVQASGDIEEVAAHELGHLLGIDHVMKGEIHPDPPTMAPSADPNLRGRTLHPDDKAALCYLYPLDSYTYTCSSKCDCPATVDYNNSYDYRASCVSNRCEIIPTNDKSALYEECLYVDSCEDDLACLIGTYGNYCTKSCDSASDCSSSNTSCTQDYCIYGDEVPCTADVDLTPAGSSSSSSGSSSSSTGVCDCDSTYSCDQGCFCDQDCFDIGLYNDPCFCNVTKDICDLSCPCDKACLSGNNVNNSGCASISLNRTFILFFILFFVFFKFKYRIQKNIV